MTYRIYDGTEFIGVAATPIQAYAYAETLKDPHVYDDTCAECLHPAGKAREGKNAHVLH